MLFLEQYRRHVLLVVALVLMVYFLIAPFYVFFQLYLDQQCRLLLIQNFVEMFLQHVRF